MDAYRRHAHTKPHLLGLWGTTPGPNFSYVHLNLNVINIAGPDHGEPGFVANAYITLFFKAFA